VNNVHFFGWLTCNLLFSSVDLGYLFHLLVLVFPSLYKLFNLLSVWCGDGGKIKGSQTVSLYLPTYSFCEVTCLQEFHISASVFVISLLCCMYASME